MAELNPLRAYYSFKQGRLQSTTFPATDGDYVYVLGDEANKLGDFKSGDYVEIYQDLDLTSVNIIRLDARFFQPAGMPAGRTLAAGAILKRTEVRPASATPDRWITGYPGYPMSETAQPQPYRINAGARLVVEADGLGDETYNFAAGSPAGGYTAQQVKDLLNASLTNATAEITGTDPDFKVAIRSNTSGYTATLQIKDYTPPPGSDANDSLAFYQKPSGTPIYGGDDLSAIVAAAGTFTDADLYQPIEISGASVPDNDGVNRIIGLVDSSTAILADPVTAEGAGFTAKIHGNVWYAKMIIDDTYEAFSEYYWVDSTLTTDDLAGNVSKLTGTHKVAVRLQLVQTNP